MSSGFRTAIQTASRTEDLSAVSMGIGSLHLLGDDEGRAGLLGLEDHADVFAEDAHDEELQPAEERQEPGERGPTRGEASADKAGVNDKDKDYCPLLLPTPPGCL